MTLRPTPAQARIRDTTALDLLVIAPAGCGKTEALALRVQGLLARGDVIAPRKVLVTTFSNRARDNIRERLHSYVSAATLRDRVTVTNFHGLAARLVRAHANVVSLTPDLLLPDNDWVKQRCRELKFDYPTTQAVLRNLREAKQEARTDDEVEAYLTAPGREAALAIERERVVQGRLTYDDLPRLAELILAVPQVAELYRAHFGAVIVDEFQDLTPQQLRIVNAIGLNRTTFAGDLAQGIYGFAGARPGVIDAAVRAECSAVVEFAESHRSAPAVLNMVNTLIPLTSGTRLACANPSSWPHGGVAARVSNATAADEAARLVRLASGIIQRAPNHRVGIIASSGPRRRFADAAFSQAGVATYRWDDGVLDTETAQTVRSLLRGLNVVEFGKADDPIGYLREAANFEDVIDGRDSLRDALDWTCDLLNAGISPDDIRSRIRIGDGSTLINEPGVHLLTGHTGKGQQFDWVFVIGLEDGTVPFFSSATQEELAEDARVLAVMMSRARHGVILSYADYVPDSNDRPRQKEPSRFFAQLVQGSPFNDTQLVDWLNQADWAALAAR